MNDKSIDSIIEALKDKVLTDILVTGYLDEVKGVKYFHPMFENIYFEFGNIYLKMSSVNQYWNLRIQLVHFLEEDIEIDEDDEFCVGSIQHLTLKYPEDDILLSECLIFTEQDSKSDEILIRRSVLKLGYRMKKEVTETIFVDPENHFGIKLGGTFELADWRGSALGGQQCIELSYCNSTAKGSK